jgi:alpha-ketoglutarate-dependent taurine dioxygenase
VVHSRVKTHPILFPSWAPLTEEEKARMPDVLHPLVRTHPETGRKALYVGGNSAWEIEGMPHDEGRALIRELRDFATGERFVYAYAWSVGDVLIWDNRSVMHCPTDFNETGHRRVMYRTTVKGDVPV